MGQRLNHLLVAWRRQMVAEKPRCHYCHKKLFQSTATLDHRVPRCRGGTHNRKNLVLACVECNRAKGSMTEYEFLVQLQLQKEPHHADA